MLISIFMGLLLYFRVQQEIRLDKWQLAVILFAFDMIGAINILLMYDAWVAREKEGLFGNIKKFAYLLITLVYSSIFLFLLISFVL